MADPGQTSTLRKQGVALINLLGLRQRRHSSYLGGAGLHSPIEVKEFANCQNRRRSELEKRATEGLVLCQATVYLWLHRVEDHP